MPVLDGSFEAFVTNLGKYNEGELVGEWVHFPTTEEEMKEVFERIGIGSKGEFGQVYEEWFITDYDCSIHGVSNLLGEYENLESPCSLNPLKGCPPFPEGRAAPCLPHKAGVVPVPIPSCCFPACTP